MLLPCEWFLSEPKLYLAESSPWNLGDWSARLRPSGLVWSGIDNLVRRCGDPIPSWRSSLVESGIKVTEKLGMSLGGLVFMAGQGCCGRDLVAEKQHS